ncbi:predicted protein [Uncinocarpus reesii 1704]|uniref:Protein kinase domain-containing protein n=1 Tax=Uncinocarpus reesii (strain UAMH 1704) TaxID=336963 RepID=C4JJ95_UNCRE|nr:uncharacterized protein UREG_01702 [Uncinocarpus reesii 1704]EEP76853.1 predicted protein [Uncinocarpus reesii 1704]
MVSNGQGYLIDFGASKLCPNRYLSRERLEKWKQDEVNSLEYYLFRLQSLKRFQGIQLTSATTAEEAYGGELNEWKEREFSK